MDLRERILTSDDIPSEVVHVDEWGVDVMVRGMSLADRERVGEVAAAALEAKANGGEPEPVFNASVVVATCFDPAEGTPIFTASDVPALNLKSARAVTRLAEIGSRLSGLGEEAQVEAGKDSASTLSDGSPSS